MLCWWWWRLVPPCVVISRYYDMTLCIGQWPSVTQGELSWCLESVSMFPDWWQHQAAAQLSSAPALGNFSYVHTCCCCWHKYFDWHTFTFCLIQKSGCKLVILTLQSTNLHSEVSWLTVSSHLSSINLHKQNIVYNRFKGWKPKSTNYNVRILYPMSCSMYVWCSMFVSGQQSLGCTDTYWQYANAMLPLSRSGGGWPLLSSTVWLQPAAVSWQETSGWQLTGDR